MKTTGRSVALALASALLFAACTGDDGGNGPEPTAPTGRTGEDGGGPTPVQTTTGPPGTGTYEYVNAGLRVVMEIDGNAGTLEVENGTGRELPKPDFYILDARDGTELPGRVASSDAIAAGETATFDVSFEGVEVRNIGLLVLLFGRDNYGAFVRTA